MFSKLAIFTVALAAVASAAPLSNSCNVGEQMCCNSTMDSHSESGQALLGLLNVALGPVGALVGVQCNPISIIGLNSNSCNAQPVCCEGNNFNGLIAVGCTPLSLTA